jgi:hypothetical protein
VEGVGLLLGVNGVINSDIPIIKAVYSKLLLGWALG